MTLRNLPTLRIGAMPLVALALLALLVATAVTANPTHAQGAGPGNTGVGDGNTDDYPNLSTYDNPQPCGPGAGDRLHGRAARDNQRPLRPLRRLLAHNK